MLGDSRSFKLSATSVSGTFGWKNIGASRSENTLSTPFKFPSSFSRDLSADKDLEENNSSKGV